MEGCATSIFGTDRAPAHYFKNNLAGHSTGRLDKNPPAVARPVARMNFERLVAAPATAATAAATTVAAAISAAPSAVAAAASGVFGLRSRLVHVERASAHLRAVQRSDGLFSVFIAGHLHKAEAARAPGVAVGHDADPVHLPEGFKHLPEFVFRSVKAQVSHKNILHASSPALSCRSASSMRQDWQGGDTFLKIETGAGEQSNAARSIAGLSSRTC